MLTISEDAVNSFVKQVSAVVHLQMSIFRDKCLFLEINVYLQRRSLTQAKYLEQAGEIGCIYRTFIKMKSEGKRC